VGEPASTVQLAGLQEEASLTRDSAVRELLLMLSALKTLLM
jgi:hypothetical protein